MLNQSDNSIIISIDNLIDKLQMIKEDYYVKVKLTIDKEDDEKIIELQAIGLYDEDNANYGCIQEENSLD